MKISSSKIINTLLMSMALWMSPISFVLSQELDPKQCGERIGYFINGVQNAYVQALDNADKVQKVVQDSQSTKDIYFYLAYNRTAGVSDFKGVLAQKQREFSQLTAKEFILFVLQGTLPSWVSAGNAVRFQESMRDGLRNALHGNFDQGDFDQIYGGIKFNLTGQGTV
jgi:hypothetical protein